MKDKSQPYLLQFKSIGEPSIGYISVAEEMADIPFEIKRTYWTYFTPQSVLRGGHANIDKELVLIAVSGSIKVTTETKEGNRAEFVLDDPSQGLFIPKLCWHSMQYSHTAVQVVIASNLYSEEDYIRDYQAFLNWK